MRFGEKYGESSEKSSEKIVELIFRNKHITASEMVEIVGVTDRVVEKQLAKLTEKEVIDRDGPDNGGTWVITA